MNKEKSCGAVIFTRDNEDLKFVLVKNLEGNYGFPKGHVEENETEQQTALREIKEEVGLDVEIIDGFKTFDVYLTGRDRKIVKTVIYFLATYSNQPITAQKEEIASVILLPFKQALRALKFKGAKKVLSEAYEYILENKL
jgi:bis(5'-nucleosidyl)-tetraphosphatase